MYRFFCWRYKHANFMAGNNLLLNSQISNLKPSLNTCELFETIQSYDKNANTLYSPIYADLDGKTAADDCLDIVETIENKFGITPNIYFSGSKGFHIVIPFKIESNYPHEVSKQFFASLGHWDSLDKQVYTGRRLFRVVGSVHYKTGYYKTRITKDELGFMGDEIADVCTKQIFENDYEWIHDNYLNKTVNDCIYAVQQLRRTSETDVNKSNYGVHFTPCMKKIITTAPNDGEWNGTIVTIARFFNKAAIEKTTAIDIMYKFDHWKNDSRHVEAVFNSIYRRDSHFTCRGNDILERHCDVFCMFNTTDIYEMSER